MLTIYTLSNCDTCRRAVKWLRAKGVAFAEKPIRETPPNRAELRAVLAARGGDLRKLFNTAGNEYRTLNLAEKFPTLTEAEAIALLAGNGSLVKRPFLVGTNSAGDAVGLVGFDETAWAGGLGK